MRDDLICPNGHGVVKPFIFYVEGSTTIRCGIAFCPWSVTAPNSELAYEAWSALPSRDGCARRLTFSEAKQA